MIPNEPWESLAIMFVCMALLAAIVIWGLMA